MAEEHDSWLEGIGVDVSGVLESVQETASSAVQTAGQAWDAGTTAASQAWDGGTSAAEQAWDAGTAAAGQAWDAASEAAGEAIEFVEESASDIADAASEVVDDVKEVVSNADHDAVQAFEVLDGYESSRNVPASKLAEQGYEFWRYEDPYEVWRRLDGFTMHVLYYKVKFDSGDPDDSKDEEPDKSEEQPPEETPEEEFDVVPQATKQADHVAALQNRVLQLREVARSKVGTPEYDQAFCEMRAAASAVAGAWSEAESSFPEWDEGVPEDERPQLEEQKNRIRKVITYWEQNNSHGEWYEGLPTPQGNAGWGVCEDDEPDR